MLSAALCGGRAVADVTRDEMTQSAVAIRLCATAMQQCLVRAKGGQEYRIITGACWGPVSHGRGNNGRGGLASACEQAEEAARLLLGHLIQKEVVGDVEGGVGGDEQQAEP